MKTQICCCYPFPGLGCCTVYSTHTDIVATAPAALQPGKNTWKRTSLRSESTNNMPVGRLWPWIFGVVVVLQNPLETGTWVAIEDTDARKWGTLSELLVVHCGFMHFKSEQKEFRSASVCCLGGHWNRDWPRVYTVHMNPTNHQKLCL